jgi:2-amino-4-ketopentanoate thiolase alpha subunit
MIVKERKNTMTYAKGGDWVQIHQLVLRQGERAPQVPQETQRVPLEMWVKGFLLNDQAQLNTIVAVRTLSGRELTGKLVAINPRHVFDYGNIQPELIGIGEKVRVMVKEM